jgi:hypothetical protein
MRRSGDWAETSFAPLCRVFPQGRRQLRPSEETFSQHYGPVFCQHGGRACSADPANPFGVGSLSAEDVLYSTAYSEARKYQMGRKPLRLCHSALHAHNVRPVRMYCMYRTMSERDSTGPRCVVTRTYPSLAGRIFSLGQPFPQTWSTPANDTVCFRDVNVRSSDPGESSCKCSFCYVLATLL